MGLNGKTILITRAATQAAEFARAIRGRGGIPVFFPTIEIHPPTSWEECDRALELFDHYNALIFTSANGVRFFFERVQEKNFSLDVIRSKPAYAVGETTRKLLENRGVRVEAVPDEFTSENLAHILTANHVRGKRFLRLQGNLVHSDLSESLQRKGAKVDSVTVYETRNARPHNFDDVSAMLRAGTIDIITFTSPSTVRGFVELYSREDLEHFQQSSRVAAIGRVTAAACEALALPAKIIAQRSTASDFVAAIEKYLHEN